jgi:formylglycine-generating enzyme required for sulfatase activity/serine/threonine protein kinase
LVFTPGKTILNGKYRLLRLIGEGGMARVWLAEEPGFGGRRVAIKEPLPAQLSADEQQGLDQRFRQEINLAPQLEQAGVPNVVRTYTVERLPDGTRLLVMEVIEGGSLAERIAAQPDGLPIEQALAITLDVLQALAGFHGLPGAPVHRDVKPENILLDASGQARLSDLGLAQLAGVSSRSQLIGGPHPGTPLYMAPEQGRSPDPLTPAADLYALGCVLFEMLTGRRYKRVRPGTAPSSLQPKVPRWLDEVLTRVLAEDPWDRYQTAGEMVAALRQVPSRAHPAEAAQGDARRPASSRGWLWALGGLLLVAIVVGLGLGILGLLNDLNAGSTPAGEVADFPAEPSPTPAVPGIVKDVTAGALQPGPSPTPFATAITMPSPEPLRIGDTKIRPADGMVMVYVPAGEFLMGTLGPASPSAESPHPGQDELPQHTVHLDGFWIDRTEVSNGQYVQCVNAGFCQAPSSCAGGDRSNPDATNASHPVSCVQWEDAHDYCQWAGGRLPTEAEWEKAARGTDGREYPWGDDLDPARLNGSDNAHSATTGCWAYTGDDGFAFSAPVGSYPGGASPFGALDMSGNVYEWVNDWWSGDYYAQSPLQNPQGPASGSLKISRGGGWCSGRFSLRTWAKLAAGPADASQQVGFRCAASASP